MDEPGGSTPESETAEGVRVVFLKSPRRLVNTNEVTLKDLSEDARLRGEAEYDECEKTGMWVFSIVGLSLDSDFFSGSKLVTV